MSVIQYFSKSRGLRNLLSRIRMVLQRFGFTAKKFECSLKKYVEITSNFECFPTFAITAVILKRHSELIRELHRKGIEFTVHGYVHVDYKVLSLDEQHRHFLQAIDIFNNYNVSFLGFRAPFLRINGHSHEVLNMLSFGYDSSQCINWDVIDLNKFSKQMIEDYNRLMDFYCPLDPGKCLALPRYKNNLIEIPVSIPDDELLIDRLLMTDEREISKIWKAILEETYRRGELFTLALHPERILLCARALGDLLQETRSHNPPVWIATLKDIAEWWSEKSRFSLEVNAISNNSYEVKADCSDRATILIKKCTTSVDTKEWYGGYLSVNARNFVIGSSTSPVIGVSRESSKAAIDFLRREGYVVENGDNQGDYGIYFNNLIEFDESAEKKLIDEIEQAEVPLLRYWRWPNQSRSAMSVTGDIDSITLSDFALRIFENFQQSMKR